MNHGGRPAKAARRLGDLDVATPQRSNDTSTSQPQEGQVGQALPVLLPGKPSGVVLSASQLSTWDLCQRRWAFEYIWQIRMPPHPSAVLGTKVHAVLEKWLRDATPPPEPQGRGDTIAVVAKRMIATLIKSGVQPGQGAVERRFWIQSARGICYTGFIDWSGWLQDELGQLATVTDHKTSGNIEAYGKTEADLHNDIQAVLYSIVGMIGFGVDTLRLFWNYGETKNRHPTKAVKTIVHLPVVQRKFDIIDEEAQQLVYHRNAATDPRSFRGNPNACGAFGGCPHKGVRCVLTAEEQLGGFMNTTQSMADRLASMTGQQPQSGSPNQGYALPQQAPQQQAPQQQAPPADQNPQNGQQYAAPPHQNPQQGFSPPPQPPQTPQQGYPPTAGPNPPETAYGAPPQGYPQGGVGVSGMAQQHTPPPAQPQPQQQQQQQLPHTQAASAQNTEAEAESGGKGKGKGRPRGAKNKNKLNHEEVFMMGIQGLFSNPNFNPASPEAVAQVDAAGELAVQAYRRRFEG